MLEFQQYYVSLNQFTQVTNLMKYLVILLVMVGCAAFFYNRGMCQSKFVTATYTGNLEQMIELLNSGCADVDGAANDDWTPLTIAAREGNVEVIKWLIINQADVNKKEGGGSTPLDWAMDRVEQNPSKENEEVVRYLKSIGAVATRY